MIKKIILLLLCAVVLVNFTACQSNTSSNSQEEMQMEELYRIQNYPLTSTRFEYYLPSYEENQNYVYERLFYYRQQTGATLSFEDIQEYLSSEHEEDGSVRMYNNGNWPEIEQYVDWYWENEEESLFFHDEVLHKLVYWENSFPKLEEYKFYELSPHNVNEILLTMEDESYKPNFVFE